MGRDSLSLRGARGAWEEGSSMLWTFGLSLGKWVVDTSPGATWSCPLCPWGSHLHREVVLGASSWWRAGLEWTGRHLRGLLQS